MRVVRRTGDMEKLLTRFGVENVDAQVLRAACDAWSENTVRALRSDLKIFGNWCAGRELQMLPARAETVARFIESTTCDRAPATVLRYVSSVCVLHKTTAYANPGDSTVVRLALQRMRRGKNCRQRQALGLTWELCERMIEAAGNRLADLRDRALLAVAYDAMLRRSELVALEVSDLSETEEGRATLLVRRSKTDQTGNGAVLFLTATTLQLLREWLEQAQIQKGRLFRSVSLKGVPGESLDGSQIPRIIKEMARKANFEERDIERFSSHSPRVGATQDMIASDQGLAAVMQAGRWKTSTMAMRYGERLLAQRAGTVRFARLNGKNRTSG